MNVFGIADDVSLHFMSWLEVHDLQALTRVSTLTHHLTERPSLHTALLNRDFGESTHEDFWDAWHPLARALRVVSGRDVHLSMLRALHEGPLEGSVECLVTLLQQLGFPAEDNVRLLHCGPTTADTAARLRCATCIAWQGATGEEYGGLRVAIAVEWRDEWEVLPFLSWPCTRTTVGLSQDILGRYFDLTNVLTPEVVDSPHSSDRGLLFESWVNERHSR